MSFKLTGKRRIFFNVFALFVILLCVRLSIWQMHRAEEKASILSEMQQASGQDYAEPDLDLTNNVANQFKMVRLTGTFLEQKTVFIDNQVVNQRVGYDVLMPFKTVAGHIFWVNRGWIPAALTRDSLPKVPAVSGEQTIKVQVIVPKKKAFRLGDVQDKYLLNRFQVLDLTVLNEFFESSLTNSVMILQKNNPGSLTFHYHSVVVPPERHKGYAVQWIGIALVWIIFTFYANT